jgi:hypothetical protein
MTDVELCYGSADGVALRAQDLYREKFPARPVPHSQTFLAIVYGKMVLTSVNRGQRAYAILKTGRKPVNKYPAVSTSIVFSCASIASKRFHLPARVLRVDESKVRRST